MVLPTLHSQLLHQGDDRQARTNYRHTVTWDRSKVKPTALKEICHATHLPTTLCADVPHPLTMNFNICIVSPADCFFVLGASASAPATTIEIVWSDESDTQPRFCRSAERTILADLGRVCPLFCSATWAMKCLHIKADAKH